MAYAMPVQILGPFRQEDCLPTLGTVILQSAVDVFLGARGSEFHDATSAMLFPLSRTHGSAIAALMKQ
jgi:hypothetical protein